jgi:hypothetical protein
LSIVRWERGNKTLALRRTGEREWLMHDSDLDGIREHPHFAEILALFPD